MFTGDKLTEEPFRFGAASAPPLRRANGTPPLSLGSRLPGASRAPRAAFLYRVKLSFAFTITVVVNLWGESGSVWKLLLHFFLNYFSSSCNDKKKLPASVGNTQTNRQVGVCRMFSSVTPPLSSPPIPCACPRHKVTTRLTLVFVATKTILHWCCNMCTVFLFL